MGFKNLFKVRQPGNGEAFENKVAAAKTASKAWKVSSTDNSQNSGAKKEVSK